MSQSYDFAHAPGHLIRRAQQIAVAVFAQELAVFDVTPVQFAILNALMDAPGTDQVTLAARVAFDAATSGSVIGRLEAKGWVRREASPQDRRRKLLWLTPKGKKAVLAMAPKVAQVQELILLPLKAQERQQLMDLLAKLVSAQSSTGS
jgi:DNA-binding MarR family transcriptional regulator